MSCACGNRRRWQDVDRIRGLAKTWAKMENETVVENEIVEYITPY